MAHDLSYRKMLDIVPRSAAEWSLLHNNKLINVELSVCPLNGDLEKIFDNMFGFKQDETFHINYNDEYMYCFDIFVNATLSYNRLFFCSPLTIVIILSEFRLIEKSL